MTYRPLAVERTGAAGLLVWAQAGLLVVNLAWTTLHLGGYRPESFAGTISLTGALLVVHALAWFVGDPARGVHPASWALGPFLLYAAFNAAVITPVAWLGGRDWLNWANFVALFWVTLNGIRNRGPRRLVFGALVALAVVGVFMSAYQVFVRPGWLMLGREQVEQFVGRGSGPFGIPNSFGGFLLLVIPAAVALTLRRGAPATHRVLWGWLAAVLLVGLFLTLSRGAWLALGITTIAATLLATTGSWRRRSAWSAMAILGVLGLVAVTYAWSAPARARLDNLVRDQGELSRPILWHAAWELFRSRPIAGTGAGSFGVLFERHRPARFADDPQWAHNEALNTLSDYGLMGMVLFVGGVGLAWRQRCVGGERASTADELDDAPTRRALGLGVLAFLLQALVDFHFKVPALAMAAAVVAALAMRGRAGPDAIYVPRLPRRAAWPALLCGLAGVSAIVWARPALQGEGLRYRVRERLDRELTATAPALPPLTELETELRQAVRLAPRNAQAWTDLAYVLELRAVASPPRLEALAGPAEEAARHALGLSPVLPESWLRLGVALDMQGRRKAAEEAFQRALALAPNQAAGWYYYAYHLSLDTNERSAALRAIAKSLSLDPGNRAAEALRATITELR